VPFICVPPGNPGEVKIIMTGKIIPYQRATLHGGNEWLAQQMLFTDS
jgi:hypothetical protein